MQQPSSQFSPNQIKEKLLQALDSDNNVVNMALALEVVSLLERTAITKEALETTRLGKLVNEMRKKTKNDSLAKRAKDLVRRWRDMVAKPAENGIGGTGQGPGSHGLPLSNHTQLMNVKNSLSSPALFEYGKKSSPALPKPMQGLITTPSSPAFRGVNLSPALQRKPSHPTGGLQQRVVSPSNSVASNASTSPGLSFSFSQTQSNSSRPSTPSSLVVKSKALSPGPGRPVLDSTELSAKSNHQRAFKRTREHDEETMTGFELSGKRSRVSNGVEWALTDECSRDSNLSWSGDSTRLSNHAVLAGGEDRSISSSSKASRLLQSRAKVDKTLKEQNPDVLKEKFASIARMQKVKTTQEIVEDLARRSGSPSLLAKSEFQPFQNQTQTTTASSETRQWPDAKQEIMAKFLQSHPPQQPEREPMVPFAAKPPVQTSDQVAEIYARLPPLDPASVAELWTEEVGVEVEEDEEISSTKPKPVVTEELIDQLHSGELDGINGARDSRNEFHEWHETMTVASYHGDPLHLLPYVVIE